MPSHGRSSAGPRTTAQEPVRKPEQGAPSNAEFVALLDECALDPVAVLESLGYTGNQLRQHLVDPSATPPSTPPSGLLAGNQDSAVPFQVRVRRSPEDQPVEASGQGAELEEEGRGTIRLGTVEADAEPAESRMDNTVAIGFGGMNVHLG